MFKDVLSTSIVSVQRLFSMFPAGRAGVALLILRLSASSTLLFSLSGAGFFKGLSPSTLALSALAFVLVIGLFTPIVCVLVFFVQVTTFRYGCADTVADGLLHIALTSMLLMLGPGAYSVDAKRFGRRIVLPPQ
jgi:uncharacterized membrane protein YphA (DoxX/SURF4 family)